MIRIDQVISWKGQVGLISFLLILTFVSSLPFFDNLPLPLPRSTTLLVCGLLGLLFFLLGCSVAFGSYQIFYDRNERMIKVISKVFGYTLKHKKLNLYDFSRLDLESFKASLEEPVPQFAKNYSELTFQLTLRGHKREHDLILGFYGKIENAKMHSNFVRKTLGLELMDRIYHPQKLERTPPAIIRRVE